MRRGQLTLQSYVVIFVVFIFIVVSLFWLVPLISSTMSSDPTSYTGGTKWLIYLFPGALIIAGLAMFFAPNATVMQR